MIKRFKNENMNCHIDKDAYDDRLDTLGNLLSDLQDYDCQQISDPYCLGNFEMAIDIYSAFTERKYMLRLSRLESWKAGKVLKLYAVPMEHDDWEALNADWF